MQERQMSAHEHWVVIPAAGRGTRMGGRAGDDPKSLLKISGKPLLRHNLELLDALGFVRAIVVVGYQRDRIKAELGDRVGDLRIHYVTAVDYATTEHGFSVYLSRQPWMSDPGPVLLTDADNFFDPLIVERLLQNRDRNLIAVHSGLGNAKEEELVLGWDGEVTGFVRGRLPETPAAIGLFLGLCRFTQDYMSGCYPFMEKLFARHGRGFKYERVFDLFHNTAERPMSYVNCDDLQWVNLNRAEDLSRARHLAVENSGPGRSPLRR